MKDCRIYNIVFILIMAVLFWACAPAATAVPSPTVTAKPPTPTVTAVPPTATPDPLVLIKSYETALNQHDIQGLMALLRGDAHFAITSHEIDAGDPTTINGLFSHEMGMNIAITVSDCQAAGAVVTCKQIYYDDCTIALNRIGSQSGTTPEAPPPDEVVFTIQNGKFQSIVWHFNADGLKAYEPKWAEFAEWVTKTYLSEWEQNGKIYPSFESGANTVKWCKEFAATKN